MDNIIPEGVTPESIKAAILERLDWDTREGSFADALCGPMALELWKAYQTMNGILPMVYLDETSGGYIDRRCAAYGIARKAGAKARAELSITGKAGTKIPAGTVFLTADGLEYRSLEPAVMGEAPLLLPVEAAAVGSAYNVRAGEITRQLSSLAGISALYNPEPATGGADPESDAALVKRYYDRLRQPATSGNIHHYQQWALETEGVGAAKVQPLFAGPGTVQVLLAGMDRGPVDEAIVQRCAAHIEECRPIGAEVTVQSAKARPVSVAAQVTLDGSTTLLAVEAEYRARLLAYLREVSFTRYEIPYSRIAYLLAGIDGVSDYQSLTLNGGSANLVLAADEVPTLGEVALS